MDFPNPAEHIDTFSGEELDEKLDEFVKTILESKVNVDTSNGEIILPKYMAPYKEDYGNTDEGIIRFVWRFFHCDELDEETAVHEVCTKRSMMLRFE